jgi:thymidine phosphorylase
MAILRGEITSGDLYDCCIELSAWMLYLGGRAANVANGKQRAKELISSGHGLEKFREIIRLQGGDPRVCDDVTRLPHARNTVDIPAASAGFVEAMACESMGVASVVLGGGRERKEDAIDPAVGIVVHKRVGDAVKSGEPLCTVHYNADARLGEARGLIERAYRIAPAPPKTRRPLVHKVIGA